MPKIYEPLTPKNFPERLASGHYKTLSSARRSLTRAGWSDKVKRPLMALVNEYFDKLRGQEQLKPTMVEEPKHVIVDYGVRMLALAIFSEHEPFDEVLRQAAEQGATLSVKELLEARAMVRKAS